ncbi:Maintenance of ploidy protein mob1 [Phytophthora palmivora]|uniref:Maintenance of ploidy protein mob1 n=1 Tax=Phytophthora palmivora TaxID=4796 RepID=A0A2P4X839_9STRA|nr:Maintenance of ploidy protein mob1 [Phytophthora palmivora]
MLRKFFLSGNASDGTASSINLDATKKTESNDSCGIEFAETVERLEHFEAGLKDTINKLSRHCQAICEVVASSRELGSCLHNLYGGEEDEHQTTASEARKLLADVATFRTSSIAPLQTILAGIPQLKLRCDHRNSAKSVVLRYERKVEEIQSSTRHESSRLRRNRAKHQVALARFKEIDGEVLADAEAVLANDLSEVSSQTIEKVITAKWMHAEATSLQKHIEGYRALVAEKKLQQQALVQLNGERINEVVVAESSSDSDNDSNNNADDKHSEEPIQSDKPSSPRYPTATASPKKLEDQEPIRIMSNHVLNQDQSICPRKKHVSGTRTWNLHRHIKDSMASGLDLADCIQLPEGCQRDEWIAVHVIDFFNEISLLFGTISEFCTHTSCPQMSAGPCYTYLWADGVQQVTPVSLPASEYVARLLEWVEGQLDDPQLFPDTYNTATSSSSGECNSKFTRAARNILKRLFRVYAHMYHNHLQNYVALHAESHLNFCFKRFILFVRQFELIEQKELNALRKLFKRFILFVRQFELIEQKELNALRKLIQTVVTKPIANF